MLEEIERTLEGQDVEDTSEESTEDSSLDETLALVPLNKQQRQIVQDIVNAPTQEELQAQFDLFNINQSKKNALRIIKLNSLLDRVEDQAIRRFETRPDQISNKELLEYMQVVAGQIDRSQKFIETIKDKPMIRVNNQHNEVNINIGTELNRDSKERVIDAIQALLKQLDSDTPTVQEEDIVDVKLDDPEEEEPEDTVYNVDSSLLNEDEGDD